MRKLVIVPNASVAGATFHQVAIHFDIVLWLKTFWSAYNGNSIRVAIDSHGVRLAHDLDLRFPDGIHASVSLSLEEFMKVIQILETGALAFDDLPPDVIMPVGRLGVMRTRTPPRYEISDRMGHTEEYVAIGRMAIHGPPRLLGADLYSHPHLAVYPSEWEAFRRGAGEFAGAHVVVVDDSRPLVSAA